MPEYKEGEFFGVDVNEACIESNGDGTATLSVPMFARNGGEKPFAKVTIPEDIISDNGDNTCTVYLDANGKSNIVEANHPVLDGEKQMENDDIYHHFAGFDARIKPDYARDSSKSTLDRLKGKAKDENEHKAPTIDKSKDTHTFGRE